MRKAFSSLILLLLSFALTAAAWSYPLSSELVERNFESLDPATTKLKSLQAKKIVLIIAGRNSYNDAHQQLAKILLAFPNEPDLVGIIVADLPGVPGFVRNSIISMVTDTHKATSQKVKNLPSKGPKVLSILDWQGAIAQEVGANGDTADTYHLLVVDRGLNNRLQMQQKVNGVTEKQIFEDTCTYLEKSVLRRSRER